MSFGNLLRHQVTILRDTFADTPSDWNQPVQNGTAETTVRGLLQPIAPEQEVRQANDTGAVASSHRLFLAWGTDIVESDRVRYGGDEYQVRSVRDPAGQGHHITADLVRVRPQ